MAFAEARDLLADAVATRVSPAAVVEVGHADRVLWQEAFGRLSYLPDAAPASPDTIFDVASLTKVMATTSIAMRLVGEGRLTLDTTVADVLEGWRTPERAAITVRHLLEHSSGLPGVVKLWEEVRGRAAFARAIAALPLERAPGAAAVYSDPGFMTLGFLLEAVAGRSLDEEFGAFAGVWGADLMYLPPVTLKPRIAPTEFDAARGGFHHGDVHDENASALGGVAGHAGLFGTAGNVGAFARTVLRTFRDETMLGSPALMRTCATPSRVPASSRALGWDTMRPTSSCGTLMSPTSIGHTGFTGTSLWIDWERDLYVVLLMNRVHPTRENERHIPLRPRVHEAIVREIG